MPEPVQLPTIKCTGVSYRQGFVEVSAGVHSQHVNVEIWNVHPDQDISGLARVDQLASNQAVVGNTEVELNIDETNVLIDALRKAVQLAAGGDA